jgi:hypothetical protein
VNYFPYFRGKQYELICIRENADLLRDEGFVAVVEPVRESGSTLKRALHALNATGAKFLIVANPSVGSHTDALAGDIQQIVRDALEESPESAWIYNVRNESDVGSYLTWAATWPTTAILHDGLSSGAQFAATINGANLNPSHHIFTQQCSKPYRKHFQGPSRVEISDGFKKKNNRDYPVSELFSDLNVTYADDGMTGFGDYLIVGSEYSESGGPAYAVAIHITYVDPDNDGAIYVFHFVSDRVDTPTDPAGKFREALAKLIAEANRQGTKIRQTSAIDEFRRLHEMQHFPGLGYVKKLSMQHHLELLAD